MSSEKKTGGSLFAIIVIPVIIVFCYVIFYTLFGNPANFKGGTTAGHPLDTNPQWFYATVYKGGIIVPILMSIVLIVITFTVERFITISKAKGRGRIDSFIREVRTRLNNDQVNEALELCDTQRGSVANVVRSGLQKYQNVRNDNSLDRESKIAAVKDELEEATQLELPMLTKNLFIISTCASIATLVGLIGTVLGMIKSFGALSSAGGTVDAAELSAGISEALINTAIGIGGSCIAIIMYNYFSNKIDAITHGIDEAGFTVSQTFSAKNI
ncbi:MAG TPA: MotA/TolQ/ExbB proton channel family protein [Flavobacteriales bacterium]|nr:MotA/TolQ/ExbB proton channel family protein [Flavobacteriales bacterium]